MLVEIEAFGGMIMRLRKAWQARSQSVNRQPYVTPYAFSTNINRDHFLYLISFHAT
jgi:hypothetical protein